MVLRSPVTSTSPGLMSITGRSWWAKVLSSATGFHPGSKSKWERTSRVVHCPGASLLSRYGSIPWSCALSCAQALFARPRRSLTVACAMARILPIPESTALADSPRTLLAEVPARLDLRPVGEPEALHPDPADVGRRLLGRVRHKEIHVVGGDGALLDQRAAHELQQRLPELHAHEHERKVADLSRLDERRRLGHFVQRPEAAGHRDVPVGVLHEHDLANEEVSKRHPPVEVGVG